MANSPSLNLDELTNLIIGELSRNSINVAELCELNVINNLPAEGSYQMPFENELGQILGKSNFYKLTYTSIGYQKITVELMYGKKASGKKWKLGFGDGFYPLFVDRNYVYGELTNANAKKSNKVRIMKSEWNNFYNFMAYDPTKQIRTSVTKAMTSYKLAAIQNHEIIETAKQLVLF